MNQTSRRAVLVAVASISIGACKSSTSSPPAQQTRSVTVTRSGNGTGSIVSSPAGVNCGSTCSASFDRSSSVTLTAAPDANSALTAWSGACAGTSASCVIPAGTSAASANAEFNRLPAAITVTRAGNGTGSVSSSPAGINCGTQCAFSFAFGTTVTLVAAPSANSEFLGWSGAGCSGTGTCVVSVDLAATVSATFALVQHTLTVTKPGTGAGTVTSSPAGISCGSDCTEPYTQGTSVTLTAAAAASSLFAGWSGGGCSGTGSCVVTMNAATTVSATFVLRAHSLSVSKAGAGTGMVTSSPPGISCGSDCTETMVHGTVVTLTASTGESSVFAGWSGDACGGTGPCVVTLTGATSITATFDVFQQLWPDNSTRICSDGTVSIACPGGPAGQDGNVLINVPSYLVMGGRVRDQASGLSWERTPLFTATNHANAVAYCSGLVLDGFDDWRLPSLLELVSLIDLGRTGPGFNIVAFPGIPPNSFFWTSTLAPGSTTAAYRVGTNYAVTSFGTLTEAAGNVARCVRGSAFAGGYSAGAGTVSDSRTGMEWQSGTAPGTMSWQSALAYCEALVLDGRSDWRLPNGKELLSLVDPTAVMPTISTLFASRPATTFWTSSALPSPFANTGYAVSFAVGGNPDINFDLTTPFSVRCVRGFGIVGSS